MDYLCWAPVAAEEEPVEEGDALKKGGHGQHCVRLKGPVSILRGKEDFEEIISAWGVTEEGGFGMEDRRAGAIQFITCERRLIQMLRYLTSPVIFCF